MKISKIQALIITFALTLILVITGGILLNRLIVNESEKAVEQSETKKQLETKKQVETDKGGIYDTFNDNYDDAVNFADGLLNTEAEPANTDKLHGFGGDTTTTKEITESDYYMGVPNKRDTEQACTEKEVEECQNGCCVEIDR